MKLIPCLFLTVTCHAGMPVLWQTNVGPGFSSVAISTGRLYTAGNKNDTDTIFCLNAKTGQRIWANTHPCTVEVYTHEGDGTASTPVLDGQKVYFFGRNGDLLCLDAATGKTVWSENVAGKFGVKIPLWGFAGSPLPDGNLLLLNAGTSGMAVNKQSGKLAWLTGPDRSGYSTPLKCAFDGRDSIVIMTGSGVVALEEKTGAKQWEKNWKSLRDINVAQPVQVQGRLFVSSFYGETSALLQPGRTGVATVWQNHNLRNQVASSVFLNGYLYGLDGKIAGGDAGGTTLRCLDARTGAVQWSCDDAPVGGFTIAAGKFIILTYNGELITAPVTPERFVEESRFQALGGQCLTPPMLADGCLYCRSGNGTLICFDYSK
jgi:outer membrane protein assembly factor BamB